MANRVPEKYLQLNAAFQQLRTVLGRLGIKHLEVEGLLTGDPITCIHVIQIIFFSPLRKHLAFEYLAKYGLSQSNSDFKLVDTVFRICRAELGISTRLSVEQFLNGGNFTVKRLELLTEIAIAIGKRCKCTLKQEDCNSTHSENSQISRPVVVEEEDCIPPQPINCEERTTVNKDDRMDSLLHATRSLHTTVRDLEEKFCCSLESLDARLCIVEGRLRILDKLQPAPIFRDT